MCLEIKVPEGFVYLRKDNVLLARKEVFIPYPTSGQPYTIRGPIMDTTYTVEEGHIGLALSDQVVRQRVDLITPTGLAGTSMYMNLGLHVDPLIRYFNRVKPLEKTTTKQMNKRLYHEAEKSVTSLQTFLSGRIEHLASFLDLKMQRYVYLIVHIIPEEIDGIGMWTMAAKRLYVPYPDGLDTSYIARKILEYVVWTAATMIRDATATCSNVNVTETSSSINRWGKAIRDVLDDITLTYQQDLALDLKTYYEVQYKVVRWVYDNTKKEEG